MASSKYECKLYQLDKEEFVGSIKIDENVSQADQANNASKHIETVIILDRSGSMGDTARCVTNEIIPLFLSELSYKPTDNIHFITFDSTAQLYSVTVDDMECLPITAMGGTNMAFAVIECQKLFASFTSDKRIRCLTVSDGEVSDPDDTKIAANELVEFLKTRSFSINSQAVRLFTSSNQPDTTALSSMLQLNNTTKTSLVDISTWESNEVIAKKFADLFRSDNFSKGQSMNIESSNIQKFPWEDNQSSQLTLTPGENLFWLKGAPSGDFKVGDTPVEIAQQEPMTLLKFQSLMEEKLDYIIDHMKVLKVIGTEEANEEVEKMVNYFEKKETQLSEKSILVKYFKMKSVFRSKITKVLKTIAEDVSIKDLNSAQKAEYLQSSGYKKEEPSWFERAAEMGIDIDRIANFASFDFAQKDFMMFVIFLVIALIATMGISFLILIILLGMVVMKLFSVSRSTTS